jgi:hypothetical protein
MITGIIPQRVKSVHPNISITKEPSKGGHHVNVLLDRQIELTIINITEVTLIINIIIATIITEVTNKNKEPTSSIIGVQ